MKGRPSRVTAPATQIAAVAALVLGLAMACRDGSSRTTAVSSADISEGKTLYEAHGCAACHGRDGRGDGPLARTLRSPPRDLSRADGFRTPREITAIAELIGHGMNAGLAVMPAYPHLDQADRRRLAAYVLSIAGAPPARTLSGRPTP